MIFNPVFPSWLIVVLLTLFMYYAIWIEWQRSYRFRPLRIASAALMVLALAGLLLKPQYRGESSSIFLLTEGYAEKKVDSILQKHPHLMLMHLDSTPQFKDSKHLPYYSLPVRNKEILYVSGEGIPSAYLDGMESKSFKFIPTASPSGITALFFSAENVLNRKNAIQGVFDNPNGSVWIYLNGPAGKKDSVFLQKEGSNNFELSFIPKQPGEFLYTLLIQDSVTSYIENLPIYVTRERSLKILFLQHYPAFETQYLKSFLKRKNHCMVLRSQVSKKNYHYEYVNCDPIQINRLSQALLQDIDILIGDQEALSNLSPAEKSMLESAVHSGLGLLNLSVVMNKNSKAFFPFEVTPSAKDTTSLRLGHRSFDFPVPNFRVNETSSITPLQRNKSGILSGYTFRGAGKIGFQLLQETYRLSLSGDSIGYSELWTPLLENVARRHTTPSKIKIVTPFPWYQNEPVDIEVISSSENVSVAADGVTLPLKEDIGIDNVWHTRTWAGKPGWHRLAAADGTSLSYYVSESKGWRSLFLANQIKANQNFKHAATSPRTIDAWEDVSPLLFYLIFLLTAGFIWIAPKL